MSAVERPGGHPVHDDTAGAHHLAAAGAQVLAGRGDTAYRALLDHFRACTAECRQGYDCTTAETLRTELRAARAAEGTRG